MKHTKFITLLSLFFLIVSCSNESTSGGPSLGSGNTGNDGDNNNGQSESIYYSPQYSLKEVASYYVGVGATWSRLTSSGSNYGSIVGREFNSITAGNAMKGSVTNPETIEEYNWEPGDEIINFAEENNQRVHGHTLIWHNQYPGWIDSFSGTDEQFEAAVEKYVKDVVSHYKGKVASWDVVNEALESNGSLRTNSPFYQRMGEDYIKKVFTWAREADPDVKLFYNDYSLASTSSKTQGVVNLVNSLKDAGVDIDGIGLQMHIRVDYPTNSTITSNVKTLTDTGLLIHFSELDVIVNDNGSLSELTYNAALDQKNKYKDVFEIYDETVPDDQKFGVTIWGVRDIDSWLNPNMNNHSDWPLLFGLEYEYKIAHEGIIEALKD